jgi:hypothetical protein
MRSVLSPIHGMVAKFLWPHTKREPWNAGFNWKEALR